MGFHNAEYSTYIETTIMTHCNNRSFVTATNYYTRQTIGMHLFILNGTMDAPCKYQFESIVIFNSEHRKREKKVCSIHSFVLHGAHQPYYYRDY